MRRELAHFSHVRIARSVTMERRSYCDVTITPKAHRLQCIENVVKPALDA